MYYRVTVPIPSELGTAIEPYRQQYDTRSDQIPPHIGVVSPFNCDTTPEPIVNHLKEIGETYAPIKVSMVGWDIRPRAKGYDLRLPIIAGREQLIALRNDLLSDILQPLAPTGDQEEYWPAVHFGKVFGEQAAHQARKNLKQFEPQFMFRITYLELWHTQAISSDWELHKKIGLEATLVSRRRRNKTPSSSFQSRP
jgi:hypothetical protein